MTETKPLRPKRVEEPESAKEVWPELKLDSSFYNGEIALGNVTQWKFLIGRDDDGLHVAIETCGYWVFTSPASPQYVAEKLDMLSSDAEQVADLINAQMEDGDIPPVFGSYDNELCEVQE